MSSNVGKTLLFILVVVGTVELVVVAVTVTAAGSSFGRSKNSSGSSSNIAQDNKYSKERPMLLYILVPFDAGRQ